MNDPQRLACERLFDDEVPEAERDALLRELVRTPAADAYFQQLGRLRELSRRHDPAALQPRAWVLPESLEVEPAVLPFVAPGPGPGVFGGSSRKLAGLCAIGALAACLLVWGTLSAVRPKPAQVVVIPKNVAPVTRPSVSLKPTAEHPGNNAIRSLEANLSRWANAPAGKPETVARLILSHSSTGRRRSSGREILALKLANSATTNAESLQRVAASRSAKVVGSVRRPANVPRRQDLVPPRA